MIGNSEEIYRGFKGIIGPSSCKVTKTKVGFSFSMIRHSIMSGNAGYRGKISSKLKMPQNILNKFTNHKSLTGTGGANGVVL